jgi:hypothetical protein
MRTGREPKAAPEQTREGRDQRRSKGTTSGSGGAALRQEPRRNCSRQRTLYSQSGAPRVATRFGRLRRRCPTERAAARCKSRRPRGRSRDADATDERSADCVNTAGRTQRLFRPQESFRLCCLTDRASAARARATRVSPKRRCRMPDTTGDRKPKPGSRQLQALVRPRVAGCANKRPPTAGENREGPEGVGRKGR